MSQFLLVLGIGSKDLLLLLGLAIALIALFKRAYSQIATLTAFFSVSVAQEAWYANTLDWVKMTQSIIVYSLVTVSMLILLFSRRKGGSKMAYFNLNLAIFAMVCAYFGPLPIVVTHEVHLGMVIAFVMMSVAGLAAAIKIATTAYRKRHPTVEDRPRSPQPPDDGYGEPRLRTRSQPVWPEQD